MTHPRPTASIQIVPTRARNLLTCCVVALIALGALAYGLYALGDAAASGGLIEIGKRFDLDNELNVPTWFSSIGLFTCAVLLAAIACVTRTENRRDAARWALLACAFAYLSLDEMSNLHEMLIVPIRRRLDLGGFLYFAWVLPAFALLAAAGVSYLGFVRRLDRTTRGQFLYAAAVYVGGALGTELLGGAMADWYGFQSLSYITVMMAEETLEMLGIVLFLCALLDHIRRQIGPITWRIADSRANLNSS